jgi:hypothetical protein
MDESMESDTQLNQLSYQLAQDFSQYLNVDLTDQVSVIRSCPGMSLNPFWFLAPSVD